MMADSDYDTFSRRYEYEPLPEPMRLEELSDDLRREVWNTTRQFLKAIKGGGYYFSSEVERFMEHVLGRVLKKPEDDIDTSYDQVHDLFKQILLAHDFNVVLDLIETVVNGGKQRKIAPHYIILANRIEAVFESHAAAYRLFLVDIDAAHSLFQFFPQSSEEQGKATQQAIKIIHDGGMTGAATHLRDATKKIRDGDFAGSVADSIHAVESVARRIDPNANKTLGPALTSLTKAGAIKHQALTGAFSQLYGYTNDEQGIRHALLEKDSPAVDIDEAVFMFGACASFAAYLVNKYQKMNRSRG